MTSCMAEMETISSTKVMETMKYMARMATITCVFLGMQITLLIIN